MLFEMEITGLEAASKALAGLPTKVANRAIRPAIREALKPVLAAAKANVPRDSGELAKSLVLRKAKGKPGELAMQVYTDPNRFDGAPHAAAIEFGTSEIPAQPSMAQTFAQTAQTAMTIAVRRIAQGVEHAVNNT